MVKPGYFSLKNFEVNVSFDEIIKGGGLIRKNSLKSLDQKISFEKGDSLVITSAESTLGIFESMVSSSMIDSVKDHEFILRARRIFN